MTNGPLGRVSLRHVLCPFPCTLHALAISPNTRPSLGCNIHFASPHVLHTLSVPSQSLAISAAHTTHTQYYTYNTHKARSHAPISHTHRTLLYRTVIPLSIFLPHLDLCSAVTFRSFPFLSFFFLSFCLYPISIRCSLPFYSVLFLSSPPCSRFCHPSFDFCSLTLSLSLSLAICFRGIAIIWNPGNAAVQKPRNEAKLAYKESPFV